MSDAAGWYFVAGVRYCSVCRTRRCRRQVGGTLDCTPEAFENGRKAAFVAAVEECQAYSKNATSEEAKAVAMNLAVRITQRAKKGG